ncbi:threonine-phosphate decarboxylase CobD [Vreelandella salicampi]|uniref:threonine-phosphate decarboxylase n=1 Tax=Vreelandella salicampi TaxID=1449798 RepID=A0A7Z0LNR1_9GAMM|nr:threonine-phosphate decarboxylase CobD [Halomonas salicampi]NYS62270.1 threonine-phosphate decarboxylase [Halomonas salicampi]
MNRAASAWPSHGGQASALLARFGLPEHHPLIDFSANLNPLGPPAWVPERLAELVTGLAHYPAPDYIAACEAIACHEGVSPEQVLLTNGGAEAIFLSAALHVGGRAGIVQPTFTEYARACKAYGVAVVSIALTGPDFQLDLDSLDPTLDQCHVVFICRPNNPTGTLIPRATIKTLLQMARARDCRLVIDEAFVDFIAHGDERLTPLLARFDNLILLRSLTKFYTLPGLRLGYLLADADTVSQARTYQPSWSVNHLAAELVAKLLGDEDFQARTHRWLREEHSRMATALGACGLEVIPSQANFFLVRPEPGSDTSAALFERLLRGGILARHTHNFSGLEGGWLRLALRDRADNDRLLEALDKARDA